MVHVGPCWTQCSNPNAKFRGTSRGNLSTTESSLIRIHRFIHHHIPPNRSPNPLGLKWHLVIVQITAPVVSRNKSGFPSGNRTAVSHIASLASRAPHRPGAPSTTQAFAHAGCFSQKGSASNFTEPGLGISQTSGIRGPPQGHPQRSKLWNPKMHHLM